MERSQRTRIGLLCLIPIVGILLVATLPPFEEYASLDRIGDRVPTPPRTEPHIVFDPSPGIRFHTDFEVIFPRRWKIRGPEIEADKFVQNFATKSRSWQADGANLFWNLLDRPGVAPQSTMYTNSETGDRITIEENAFGPPSDDPSAYYVAVTPSTTPLGFWPKFKRWARLIFP